MNLTPEQDETLRVLRHAATGQNVASAVVVPTAQLAQLLELLDDTEMKREITLAVLRDTNRRTRIYYAKSVVDLRSPYRHADGFRDALRQRLARQIADDLLRDEEIRFQETYDDPAGDQTVRAELTIFKEES